MGFEAEHYHPFNEDSATQHTTTLPFDANAATINAAIPQPARGALTTKQKALLLMYVVAKRYDVEV